MNKPKKWNKVKGMKTNENEGENKMKEYGKIWTVKNKN